MREPHITRFIAAPCHRGTDATDSPKALFPHGRIAALDGGAAA